MFLSKVIIIYYFYIDTAPEWVGIIRSIFLMYPPFNFSKAYGDISRKASRHLNYTTRVWEDGDIFTVDDLTDTIET